jgi:hypothetical protein
MNDEPNQFLVACMYGGWSVVSRKDNQKGESLHVVHTSHEHGPNLLYGASSKKLGQNIYKIASCTFNDRKVYEHQLFV